jgi:hypothetical protein
MDYTKPMMMAKGAEFSKKILKIAQPGTVLAGGLCLSRSLAVALSLALS